jgi:hypothetical protein
VTWRILWRYCLQSMFYNPIHQEISLLNITFLKLLNRVPFPLSQSLSSPSFSKEGRSWGRGITRRRLSVVQGSQPASYSGGWAGPPRKTNKRFSPAHVTPDSATAAGDYRWPVTPKWCLYKAKEGGRNKQTVAFLKNIFI